MKKQPAKPAMGFAKNTKVVSSASSGGSTLFGRGKDAGKKK